jgi:hypothetical protein
MWWKQILAFFFKPPLTNQEWYQHLLSSFHPPKAYMSWTVRNHRLEMYWQQDMLSRHDQPADIPLAGTRWKSSPNC